MKYAIFLLVALLALSGAASAGATLHAESNVAGTGTDADGLHTVDATVNDDGSASVLVDGASVLP